VRHHDHPHPHEPEGATGAPGDPYEEGPADPAS